jgi:hypothetical protein
MPTLKQILGNEVTLSIPFKGSEPLTIVYLPDAITQETYARLQSFAVSVETLSVQEQFNEINQVVVEFLLSWDLLEDDNVTPVPITVERLPKLPISILKPIIEAITGDMDPNSQAVQAQK